MKKLYLLPVLLLAIASCTKNEIAPVEVPDYEISYQTVINPTQTRALGANQSNFATTNKFYSTAFILTGGKTWDVNSGDATAYFEDALISYNANTWKSDGKTKYWPKDEKSSLTFFAWTNNTPSPSKDGITVTKTDGVKITGYDVTSVINNDVMVADIAKDKKANVLTYAFSGVPTLFHHKLTSFVFKAKTKASYSDATIAIESIKFLNVESKGSYAQLPNNKWTEDTGSKKTFPMFTPSTAQVINNSLDVLSPVSGDYSILLPQNLIADSEKIEIKYTIKTNYTGTEFTETVTEVKDLKDIYGSEWELGKQYILTLTIGLDEILWDPAVQDWDPVTENLDIFEL